MARPTWYGLILLIILMQPLLAACDDPFEPFAPSELTFSIFGRLEANADTQWIRVRPLQGSLTEIKEPLDAVVTVEEVETGLVTELHDSIFSFPSPNHPDTGIMVWVHNFWTTMPIVPGRHYRLTATRSDGAFSTATVRIPVITNPTVVVERYSSLSDPPRAYVAGLEHVVMVYGDTRVPPECNYFTRIYREVFIAEPWSTSALRIYLFPDRAPPQRRMLPPSCPASLLQDKRIVVVTGEEGWGWPFETQMDLRDLVLPDSLNNIEGGIGFLGGTHQLEFPFEGCPPENGTATCSLYYDSDSPALRWKPAPS